MNDGKVFMTGSARKGRVAEGVPSGETKRVWHLTVLYVRLQKKQPFHTFFWRTWVWGIVASRPHDDLGIFDGGME